VRASSVERVKDAISYTYVLLISGLLLLPFTVILMRSVTVTLPDGSPT
jgi:hypothetical protein